EDRIPHHPDLEPLEVADILDRLLAVVDVARAGVHPAKPDESRGRMIRQLLEQFIADRAIDHLLHVRVVAKHERQIEHVELGNERAHGADADARDGKRTDLGLLDHLLLAAELHRRVHLDAEAAAARRFEFPAHRHDRFHGRIAERMHVGGLEHELLLGEGGNVGRERGERAAGAEAEQGAAVHGRPPRAGWLRRPAQRARWSARGLMPAGVLSYYDRGAKSVKGMSRPSLSVTQPLPAPRSLTGELVARLTDDITSGKIPPGSRLPTEQELIAATGVSRTVVREAVAALRADGLVVTRQG